MNISTDLIAKGTAGALAAAAAIGGGIAAKNSGWFGPAMDLTKFDKGLIKWLETSGNDIVFTIKYKESGEGDEKEVKENDSTTFPSFVNDKDEPVKISVKVDDTNANLKGGGNKTPLKQLNDGKGWIWSCEMTFKKDPVLGSGGSINMEQSKRVYRLMKSDDDGLFKKLMKDVSSSADSNSKKIKELKKGFIKNCAKARTEEKNKEIEASTVFEENREIKTPKERIGFVLIEGDVGKDWGENSSLLYFKNKEEFNKWFPEDVNS